jgi:hypothetical protein
MPCRSGGTGVGIGVGTGVGGRRAGAAAWAEIVWAGSADKAQRSAAAARRRVPTTRTGRNLSSRFIGFA